MSNTHVLYSTFPNQEEAEQVAGLLLEQKLIACANLIDGVRSLYRWEGKVCNDAEVVMIAKTSGEKLTDAIATLSDVHSYDCPCVTSWPITAGNEEYLRWVNEES
ncbi:MAG: divalent-cation tolerance protein CutA [Planctomycetaceae bacterium]|nr:divalent-cation tolerance protein CutA [Planctomycetaceae bacterium]